MPDNMKQRGNTSFTNRPIHISGLTEPAAVAAPAIYLHCYTVLDDSAERYDGFDGYRQSFEVRFDLLLPTDTEAVLLVEQEGDEPSEVRDRLHRLVDKVWHREQLAFGARQAFDGAVEPMLHFLARERELSAKERRELIQLLQEEDKKRGESP